jgi:hypothetical protein
MGQRSVVEVVCDRCSRVQTQDAKLVTASEEPEFVLKFRGQEKQYDDFCKQCRRTITNYVEKILGVSPDDSTKSEKPAGAKNGARAASTS